MPGHLYVNVDVYVYLCEYIREQKLNDGMPNNDDAEQGQKSTRFMTLNWLKRK